MNISDFFQFPQRQSLAGREYPQQGPTTGPIRGYAGGYDQPYVPYGGPVEVPSPAEARPYQGVNQHGTAQYGYPLADVAAALVSALGGGVPDAYGAGYRMPMQPQNSTEGYDRLKAQAAQLGLAPGRR